MAVQGQIFLRGVLQQGFIDCGVIQEHLLQCSNNARYCSFGNMMLGNNNVRIVVGNIKI